MICVCRCVYDEAGNGMSVPGVPMKAPRASIWFDCWEERMVNNRTLALHFIDGQRMTFSFSEQVDIPAAKQLMLKSLWESDRLVIEVDGELLVFPICNIRYFHLSAPGDVPGHSDKLLKLPAHTIFGATLLD